MVGYVTIYTQMTRYLVSMSMRMDVVQFTTSHQLLNALLEHCLQCCSIYSAVIKKLLVFHISIIMQSFLLAFILVFGYVGTTLQAKPTDIHRRRRRTDNGGKHYYDRGLQAGVAGTNKTLAPTGGITRESPAPITPFPTPGGRTPFPTDGPPSTVSFNHVSSNASILSI